MKNKDINLTNAFGIKNKKSMPTGYEQYLENTSNKLRKSQ